jgi:hypothetical protein
VVGRGLVDVDPSGRRFGEGGNSSGSVAISKGN